MTSQEADELYGLPTIFPHYVVRAKEDERGLFVYVHKRNENGKEMMPLAYMLGLNHAHFAP